MSAFNGAVLLLVAAWVAVVVLDAILASPTWDEVQ